MNIEVFGTSGSVAQRSAAIIAEEARRAAAEHGRFVMAVSGGHTPWLMLRELANARAKETFVPCSSIGVDFFAALPSA